jgi:hypothetical protein
MNQLLDTERLDRARVAAESRVKRVIDYAGGFVRPGTLESMSLFLDVAFDPAGPDQINTRLSGATEAVQTELSKTITQEERVLGIRSGMRIARFALGNHTYSKN